MDPGGGGAGVFHPAGYDSDPGGLFGDFSARADVGLFLLAGRGRNRPSALVGFNALHRHSKLAAFVVSQTPWIWARAHFTGITWPRHLPIPSGTRARRWLRARRCLKIGN